MIIVTGGAGFIGSNLVRGLNKQGHEDILVIDDLTDGTKFRNIADCQISDYWDITELNDFINENKTFTKAIDVVFHQGACTDTTEQDGRYMMQANYTCSKQLLHYCLGHEISFIYASSGAVYGTNRQFTESRENESPVNVYGYSKYLFDEYVRHAAVNTKSQVTGLRYFNVYGPREAHKRAMASVIFHFNRQLLETGRARLFKGSGGFADGEQRRDFIHVKDVVAVNLWCLGHPEVSGIFNVGTGKSRSFNEVAQALIDWHGRGEIEYIPFPPSLDGCYQSFTEADIHALREAGYNNDFTSLEEGIKQYLDWLHGNYNKEKN